jgi:sugar transferase (PEP-CTERM system associated)
LIALAFVAASIARLGANDATVMLSYEQGLFKIIMVTGAFITCMYYFDLYDSVILRNRREVLTRLVQVLGTMSILLAFVFYLYPPFELGRGIFLMGLVFVAIILTLWRKLFSVLNSRSRFADRTMIFGDDGPLASGLLHELEFRSELGMRVVARVSAAGNGIYELNCGGRGFTGLPEDAIGAEELSAAIRLQRIKCIIIALSDRREKLPVELLLSMKSRGVVVQDGAEFYEAVTGKIPIESLRLGSLLFSTGFHLSRILLVYKRFASIMVSIIGLALSLPVLPFVALAIKQTSPGHLLYRQKRVGRDGKIFYCYKFRTMRADAEADTGPTWAGDDDPRITFVGRFLRTVRLDEIPQLWNVLTGDMSLIGPRPERPEFVEQLKQQIPYYNLRHVVRPGITGWAQIRYKYGSSVEDAKEKLRYDLFYIKNVSPGLDAMVFFNTVKTILLGRGAR